jgi:hypothetical protein
VRTSFELNREDNGILCTETWYSAASSALAPDAQQSSHSLCRSGHAACEFGAGGRRARTRMPGRETRCEAERWNDLRLEVLLPHLPDVGRALLKCDGADHPCGLLICAVCARAYRQGPIAQLHALANEYAGPHEIATIYLGLYRPGFLAVADVRRAQEMFRKRLDRAGFKRAIVVGNIEVAWQAHWQRWLLHAHVLAIGVDPHAWKRLEAALEKSGTADPVDIRALCNPDEQLSYCVKFVTYQQPGRRRFGLPPDRLVELAAWWSQYRFEDFFFRLWRPSSRRPTGRR